CNRRSSPSGCAAATGASRPADGGRRSCRQGLRRRGFALVREVRPGQLQVHLLETRLTHREVEDLDAALLQSGGEGGEGGGRSAGAEAGAPAVTFHLPRLRKGREERRI